MILSIDPGGEPAYTLLDPSVLLPRRFFKRALPLVAGSWESLPNLPGAVITDVIAEGQWLYGPKTKAAIITLANRAGWQLCAACLTLGGRPHFKPVASWREALGVSKGTTKKVVQNRCRSALTAPELALLATSRPGRLGDRLDSILIGWGWWLSQTKPWAAPP